MRQLLLVVVAACMFSVRATAQQLEPVPPQQGAPQPQSQPPGAQPSAAEVLRSLETIQVHTGTWLAKPEMCEGALQKHPEFGDWGFSIMRNARADAILKIDYQPGWFYYQYSLVHTASGLVLAAGNVTAWDGKVACDKAADLIVKRIKGARPTPESEDKQKKPKGKS